MNPRHPPAAIGLAAAMLLGGAATGQGASLDDYYWDRGDSVAVTIRLDRLGLLVPSRLSAAAADSVGIPLGLTPSRHFPEGLTEFATPQSLSRDSLVLLARRASTGPRVLRAGMIVSLKGVDSPTIVTDEIIVRATATTKQNQIDSLRNVIGAVVVDHKPRRPSRYLLRLRSTSPFDALTASRVLAKSGLVDYAVPNFIHVILSMGDPTLEPMFAKQWHLKNTGALGGVEDADIDAVEAWAITQGDPSVVIAIIDGGFDVHHEDLVDNLWNSGEVCDDQDDTPKNGYDDDVHGWDFYGCYDLTGCLGDSPYTDDYCVECNFSATHDCSRLNRKRCGDLDISCMSSYGCDDFHGTAVAGIAAARGDNGKGGTGVAPASTLMLIRRSLDEYAVAESFDYARENGASVINCSWKLLTGQPFTSELRDAIRSASQDGRGGKGCVITFAMSDKDNNDCDEIPAGNEQIYTLKREDGRDAVIAVSGSDDHDRKVSDTGWGECTDILAPTSGGTAYIATTDLSVAGAGYNPPPISNCKPPCPSGTTETSDQGYSLCFTGTSAAAPMVAGAAALILAADHNVTATQVQRLLEDTADKTQDQTGTQAAHYDAETGFSAGVGSGSTHGWGRLNAFEAVRVAASSAGGKGGVDVFARDQGLDWGNTEQPSTLIFEPERKRTGHWESVDIKIDAGPSWQPVPATSSDFAALTDEEPALGAANRIYIRVRNRGYKIASSVTVKVLWAYAGTSLPNLPSDFWDKFPSDPTDVSQWHPIGVATLSSLGSSGCSATRSPETDLAQIASVDFTAPAATAGLPTHFCILSILDTTGDRPIPRKKLDDLTALTSDDFNVDALNPIDNNVIQRNVVVAPSTAGTAHESFFVRNPDSLKVRYYLSSVAPTGWKVRLSPAGPFSLKPGEKKLVRATILRKPTSTYDAVQVIQSRQKGGHRVRVGGITMLVSP